MHSVTINGRDYEIPEVTFDAICQLEENGVYLLNMDRKQPKLATMLRGLVAWIAKVEPEEASVMIEKHIQNGGDIGDIMTSVTQAINSSGFFRQGQTDEKVQSLPQNRQQRRHPNDHGKSTPR